MDHHSPVQEDHEEFKRGQALWSNFMQATKWVVLLLAGFLFVLAAVFVRFGS